MMICRWISNALMTSDDRIHYGKLAMAILGVAPASFRS